MESDRPLLIIGAALGDCVHVAGVANFLRLAEAAGFETLLLGAATPVGRIVRAVEERRPAALAVSYRLTPTNGKAVLDELLDSLGPRQETTLLFGGTPAMVEVAEATGRFSACLVGGEPFPKVERVLRLLRGESVQSLEQADHAALEPVGQRVCALVQSADGRQQVPLLRHHFGLPDLEDTVAGVRAIAQAEVLDVISIAPDQDAQELFFRPERMDPSRAGAGGAPVRSAADLRRLYEASRCGNHPYLRIYSGTQDLQRWAELAVRELHNAWGTIPLAWYSELDGRSKRPLADAIRENLAVVRWYAEQGLPVEINESHHWSLRDAPDPVAIVMAYVAAYNAKAAGVRQLFAQYMFNTPSFTSAVCDLAKMAAKVSLIESLRGEGFQPYRQVRAGLSHFVSDLNAAKGQLAMATLVMLGLRPHILHVVGFTEADHAASAEEVVESCRIVQGVVRNALLGVPDPLADPRVRERSEGLRREALVLLGTLERFGRELGSDDPLADPEVLAQAIRTGLIDAPHLAGQQCALGQVRTGPVAGGCSALDTRGEPLAEADRLLGVLRHGPAATLISSDAAALIGPPDDVRALPPEEPW